MPLIRLTTSAEQPADLSTLFNDLAKMGSVTLDVPEEVCGQLKAHDSNEYFMIEANFKKIMALGGSFEPCASIEVLSWMVVDPDARPSP